MPASLKFIDLFAGTGGMRLALEQAVKNEGFRAECVFSSEIDKDACETYRLNFGKKPKGDIFETAAEIPPFDFMLAGFPCQPFSYAGKRMGFGDTRGTLFFEIEKILKKHKPKAFLLENVRGLVTHDGGKTLKTILHSLQGLGYGTKYVLCNSSNFSVPQNRVRVYILGILGGEVSLGIQSDLGAADSHAFKRRIQKPNSSAAHKTVKDILEANTSEKYACSEEFTQMLGRAIGNNFEKLHGVRLIDYRGGNSLHSWDLGIKGKCSALERKFMNALISNRRKKIYGTEQDGKMLTRGQIDTFFDHPDTDEVIASLLEKRYLKKIGQRYNPVCGNMSFEVFKFLDPNSISITLTTADSNKLGVVQDGKPRRITPRECARLQGFPDSFILHPNDTAAYRQMGNAVSVPVVKAILSDFFESNASAAPSAFAPAGSEKKLRYG